MVYYRISAFMLWSGCVFPAASFPTNHNIPIFACEIYSNVVCGPESVATDFLVKSPHRVYFEYQKILLYRLNVIISH